MSLTHYNSLNSIFDVLWPSASQSPTKFPPVEIVEDSEGYSLKAELPGLHKEDIKVSVENGSLTIAGEMKSASEGKKYYYTERKYGNFSRSFSLADDVDGKSVKASYKDGILEIRLSKAEETKPKTISVKIE